jgi:hypothetical protein
MSARVVPRINELRAVTDRAYSENGCISGFFSTLLVVRGRYAEKSGSDAGCRG